MEQVENDISMSTGSISDNISRLSSCCLLKHFINAIKPKLGVVCFLKSNFLKNNFLIFLCLFVIKKII